MYIYLCIYSSAKGVWVTLPVICEQAVIDEGNLWRYFRTSAKKKNSYSYHVYVATNVYIYTAGRKSCNPPFSLEARAWVPTLLVLSLFHPWQNSFFFWNLDCHHFALPGNNKYLGTFFQWRKQIFLYSTTRFSHFGYDLGSKYLIK
jgi:hypothetical protein